MDNLYLDLSEKEVLPAKRRKTYLVLGFILFVFGLTGLIYECFDNNAKLMHIISPVALFINGVFLLFQAIKTKLEFLKCYVSISDQLIEFRLWGFNKKRQIKWSDVNGLIISKFNIIFKLQDKTEVLLNVNLMSNNTGFKIIDSVKGFSKVKQIDCKTI
jgi:hypothetical protein